MPSCAHHRRSRCPSRPPTSPQWLLERLQLPEPLAQRAREHVDEPVAFEDLLKQHFLSNPPFEELPDPWTLHPASRSTDLDIARAFERGILWLDPSPPAEFTLPIDWARSDLGRSCLSQLHSLRFLPPLMDSYREHPDERLFETIESIRLDWLYRNPRTKPAHTRAWNEGSVSLRVGTLLELLNFYKKTGGPRDGSLIYLLGSIYEHARYLARQETYAVPSDYAVRQAWSLIAISCAIPEFADSSAWRQSAMEQLQAQVRDGFSSEGVWLQYSPAYQEYVALLLDQIIDTLLRSDGYTGDLLWAGEIRGRSESYLAHALTPEGKYPPVGDSAEISLVFTLHAEDAELTYAASSGAVGGPPEDL